MRNAKQLTPKPSSAPLRRLLLTGTSLMVLSGSALAADLPLVKAPPPVLASSWAGFYLGVHAGYGWKKDDFSQISTLTLVGPEERINGIKSQGAVYGAQAGYNWQFGRAVTGLEIDFSASSIKGSNGLSNFIDLGAGTTTTSSIRLGENVKYLGSARARLGWLPTDTVLLYGTAGLAWERFDETRDTSVVATGPAAVANLSTRTPVDRFGWVAGVGVEAMLGSPNWIGRIEYLHYDFGQNNPSSSFVPNVGAGTFETAGSQTIEVLRAGVSYKFGEPARMAAVPYAKAPVAASLSTWSGFYIGAHGGYAWGHNPRSLPVELLLLGTPGPALTGTESRGWVAGGHFGHNWQYGRFVTGLEADLSATGIKGNTNTVTVTIGPDTISNSIDEKVKYLGTLRGRLGWLPTDTVLLYGTAGLAWERFEDGGTTTGTVGAGTATERQVTPSDRFGWVAGVGGEMMLGSTNWIARLEYLHYDFGRVLNDLSINFNGLGPTIVAATSSGRQTIDLVRAGVSYKFGPDGPVAASVPATYAKAPRMAPLQSWAGFYLGAHGGYGWKQNDYSRSFNFDTFVGGIKSKGWLGGGQAGYNWQYASAVAGFEIDGSATGIKGSSLTTTVGTNSETDSDNVKYLGTVRGRLGWTPAASWLLYGTGGLAWERVHRTIVQTSTGPGGAVSTFETPRDHFGWVAGVGVETFIGGSSNWIGRLEYLHYDFGTVESTFSIVSATPGIPSTIERGGRQTIDTLRAGVSYKFTP